MEANYLDIQYEHLGTVSTKISPTMMANETTLSTLDLA